jgi:hypothetical protein
MQAVTMWRRRVSGRMRRVSRRRMRPRGRRIVRRRRARTRVRTVVEERLAEEWNAGELGKQGEDGVQGCGRKDGGGSDGC